MRAIARLNELWIVAGAVLGLIAGSFLATLAIRWPAGESLGGRSRCDSCAVPLSAAALVPLLGYLRGRGRCRSCGSPIDRRHPLFELACGLVGTVSLTVLPGIAGLAGAFLGWAMLTIAVMACEHRWIPDALTLPLFVAGLATSAVAPSISVADRAVGACAGWGVAVALRGNRHAREHGGVAGSAGLLAAAGAWLGWQALPLALLVAAGAAAAIAGAGQARRASGRMMARLPPAALLAWVSWPLWLLLAAGAVRVPAWWTV